jgi:hypothetical protein
MTGDIYPTGISGLTVNYTDLAVDAQYGHSFSEDTLSVYFNVQNEKQTLVSSSPGFSGLELATFKSLLRICQGER